MKLLFDQNLAPRLVTSLSDFFPDSLHVEDAGLARASDSAVWECARENSFAIVSKNADFQQLSFLYGSPPKVIRIGRGNCSVEEIETILRDRADVIEEFEENEEAAYLILS